VKGFVLSEMYVYFSLQKRPRQNTLCKVPRNPVHTSWPLPRTRICILQKEHWVLSEKYVRVSFKWASRSLVYEPCYGPNAWSPNKRLSASGSSRCLFTHAAFSRTIA